MHSWRALLLPYFEVHDCKYDFNEPWNSPKNLRWAESRHDLAERFHCPNDDAAHPEWTSYVAVIGPRTLWPGGETVKLDRREDEDGTILLIDVRESGIHWMEPRDLPVEELATQNAGTTRNDADGLHFVTSGGSVGVLGPSEWQILKAMATRRGGTVGESPGAEVHTR